MRDEVDAVETFERERVGGSGQYVEPERRTLPALVLVGVDVEGRPGDLAEQKVVRSDEQLALVQAQGRAALAAAAGLEEHQRAVPLTQAAQSLRARRPVR